LKFIVGLVSVLSIALSAYAQTPAAASSSTSPASNGLFIKISEAGMKKSLMAIPSFQFVGSTGSKSGVAIGKTLFDTFRNDMDVSGFFDIQKPEALPKDAATSGLKPSTSEAGGFTYDYYKQIGTEFLVRVGYRTTGDSMSVDAYVYYVPQQKQVLGKTYKASANDARTVAHTFANDVIKALTGQPGSFLSKIVVSRSTKPGEKEIFVMDWDGANAKQITRHGTISQSPSWSWDTRTIAYSSFAYHANQKTRNLDLFTYDLNSGKRYAISYRTGVNSGSSFYPDNRHLLLTISNSGQADIYKMTIDGRSLTKLTNAKRNELNVEPVISPDGSKIAFSSDRTGNAMIYVMNSDGTNVKRLTIAGKYNATPAWSPDGKKIAFAGYDASHFDIFLMNADGTNMSRLTSATKKNGKMSNNEEPTFSPDGRNIIFTSDRTGKYQLYITSLDGENERRITFDDHEYFKPRWSPKFE
jgi:TolB protein